MERPLEYFIDHSEGSDKLRLHEHEVLLSFNNDGGACAFWDWWREAGKAAYAEWCAPRLDDLSEDYG